MSIRYFSLLILSVFFCIGFYGVYNPGKPATIDFASTAVSTAKYYISGYIYSSPTKKSYLLMNSGVIESISSNRPLTDSLPVIETDSWIFPGLMNLHNHLDSSILPLWPAAKGQFVNRYEWRKQTSYTNYVKFNMSIFPKTALCPAFRWGEFKELFSGVTVTQGIGANSKCVTGFGPRNLEVDGELFLKKRASADFEVFAPDSLGKIFHKTIEPIMKSKNISYEAALNIYLTENKVGQWYEKFINSDKTIAAAMMLTAGATPDKLDPSLSTEKDFEASREILRDFYIARGAADKAAADKEIVSLKAWIFGGTGPDDPSDPFMSIPKNSILAEVKPDLADLMSMGVVKAIDPTTKAVSRFEEGKRQKMFRQVRDGLLGVIIHLSEGRRDDEYSKKEYDYMNTFGINLPSNIIIHGVGLTPANLDEVAKLNQTLIWSPFSNLLLYGQTLNIGELKKRKINFTIATDWAPSGSKSLFEELRLAKKYLQATQEATLSDKELFEAVTINAAKALGIQSKYGRIASKNIADIVILKKKSSDPYADFVNTTEQDVELTIIGGEPLYGNSQLIESYSQKIEQTTKNEIINVCGSEKAFRPIQFSDFDKTEKLQRYDDTKKFIQSKFDQHRQEIVAKGTPAEVAQLAKLDTAFSCEDKDYSAFIENYISTIWPKNTDDLKENRKGLTEGFNPVK